MTTHHGEYKVVGGKLVAADLTIDDGRIAAASPIAEGHGTRILISLPKAVVTHPSLL